MKEISEKAELSVVYTNHCLRATTSTVLANEGIDSWNICAVTGHRNVQSLESYVREPSFAKRAEMSDLLHSFGKPQTEGAIDVSGKEVVLSTTSSSVSVASSTGLFSGANFMGSTMINIQINNQ